MNCERCGKELSDPISMSRGYGPECVYFGSSAFVLDKGAKTDIIICHGFTSSKDDMLNELSNYKDVDFNIIICDARGHGDRKDEGNKFEWIKSKKEIERIINKRKKPVILIGHSMGGAEVINIASDNKYVKKVFAVAAPFDNSLRKDSNIVVKTYLEENKDKLKEFEEIMPINSDYNNKVEYYFIHSTTDSVVTFDDFENNVKKFKADKEDTFIYDIPIPGFISHSFSFYNDNTHDFIKDKIK